MRSGVVYFLTVVILYAENHRGHTLIDLVTSDYAGCIHTLGVWGLMNICLSRGFWYPGAQRCVAADNK